MPFVTFHFAVESRANQNATSIRANETVNTPEVEKVGNREEKGGGVGSALRFSGLRSEADS